MAVEAGSIGARLKAGREKMSLTVLQVAERMHTDAKIVEALEVDNYAVMGAPVYARGHIRHYAELVNESVTDLLALYANLSKVEQPDLTKIVKVPSAGDSSKLVASAVVILGVFAVAGAIWWVSALSRKKPQMSETHVVGDEQAAAPSGKQDSGQGVVGAPANPLPTQQPPSAANDMPPTGVVPSEGTVRYGAPAAEKRNGTDSETAPTRSAKSGAGAATAPTRSSTSGASAGATPAHSPTSAAGATTTRVASAAAPTPAPPPVSPKKNQSQVTLRYSSDSWTEVYDATGARLFYDVGSANSVQTMVGTPPLRVVLGNASGVAVEFNGHSMPVSKLAHPDGSVQFSINRSGRVVRAKPVPDGG
jgi:cytoskeleton protein RodZ